MITSTLALDIVRPQSQEITLARTKKESGKKYSAYMRYYGHNVRLKGTPTAGTWDWLEAGKNP